MTREEVKSCIGTIKMLQRLAYNIHGVMDVIDADNCKKIIKALKQEPCEDAVSRKKLLKIYEDRFTKLQILKHLKDNKGAEDRQMGVNYCINILKELPPVTPQEPMLNKLKEQDEPKAVRYEGDGYADGSMVYDYAYCPNCNHETEVDSENWGCDFCPNCGQRLRW